MAGCLDKFNIENIEVALDVYEAEVTETVSDPDPATSELASMILEDIKAARSKLPGLACGL